MTHFVGTIITDCADDNARARQELRFSSLFGVQPTFLGVGARAPEVEAAGNLLDQLDALTNLPASAPESQPIILVNVAPRGDKVREEWNNGTPFCFLKVGKALVVSTFAGQSLSLIAERGLGDTVELMDVPTVTAAAVEWGELTPEQAEQVNRTQFRSFEFLPLAAYWVTKGRPVPAKTTPLRGQPEVRGKVWCIDNFGNVKTTLSAKDIGFKEGAELKLADGSMAVCHRRLADVPKDTTAIVVGSSGYGDERFLEVVVQWKDKGFHGSHQAASRHGFEVGSPVLAA